MKDKGRILLNSLSSAIVEYLSLKTDGLKKNIWYIILMAVTLQIVLAVFAVMLAPLPSRGWCTEPLSAGTQVFALVSFVFLYIFKLFPQLFSVLFFITAYSKKAVCGNSEECGKGDKLRNIGHGGIAFPV